MHPDARSQVAVDAHEVQSLRHYRAVSGHFSLGTLQKIADTSSICTVLREPRARLLSLYMYWRTPGTTEFWAPYCAADHARRPLGEFLSEQIIAPVTDNQVCRMLLYGDPRLPESGFVAPSDVEAVASDAIEQLDALGFVGILELGENLWDGLTRLFDVELSPTKLNVTEDLGSPIALEPGEELLTTEVLDLIGQRSAADQLVYEHALTCAGLDARERRRLSDGAFVQQLVKLGDLVGNAAAHVAEQAMTIEALNSQLKDQERLHAEMEKTRGHLRMHEQTVQGLEDEIRRRDADLDRLGHSLDAVHASASWRLTAPLRAAKHSIQRPWSATRGSAIPAHDQSLLPGRSVGQVWWFALGLSLVIAATDAILSHVVLIALLVAGPFCGLLTGRLIRTATTGIWAVALAVLLGFPDEIWGTRIQLVDIGTVVAVALVSTFAATLIERRRYHQLR
jgi:hypothetical protein